MRAAATRMCGSCRRSCRDVRLEAAVRLVQVLAWLFTEEQLCFPCLLLRLLQLRGGQGRLQGAGLLHGICVHGVHELLRARPRWRRLRRLRVQGRRQSGP